MTLTTSPGRRSVKSGGVRVRGALKEYVGPPYEIEGEIGGCTRNDVAVGVEVSRVSRLQEIRFFPEIFDQMYAPLLVLSLIQIPEANLQKLKNMDPIDVEMAANDKPLHQLDQAAFADHTLPCRDV
ncbi:hypothetical protein Tco_0144812 [Tanacetum coccineum]